MTSPRRLLVPFLIVFALALSACTPSETPPPTSTPTLTTDDPETDVGGVGAGAELNDEQRAFEEAKAAFEAYLEAQSRLDLASPESIQKFLMNTTGSYKEGLAKELEGLKADGYRFDGRTTAAKITLVEYASYPRRVSLAVCQDVSEAHLYDSEGQRVVDEAAPGLVPITAVLTWDVPREQWLVESTTIRGGTQTC